jgi:hypothetical protein
MQTLIDNTIKKCFIIFIENCDWVLKIWMMKIEKILMQQKLKVEGLRCKIERVWQTLLSIM